MATPTTPSRQEHRPAGERREQLLDAAVAVMREGGLAAATTRAVTGRAGVPHGVFHYCFRGKEELYRAVLERELTGSLRHAWEAVALGSDLESGIADALTAYLDHVRGDVEQQLLITELTLTAARTEAFSDLPRWEQEQYLHHVGELLTQWSDEQQVTWQVPVATIAQLLTATASGLASSWLSTRDDDAAAQAVRAFARSVVSLAGSADR